MHVLCELCEASTHGRAMKPGQCLLQATFLYCGIEK